MASLQSIVALQGRIQLFEKGVKLPIQQGWRGEHTAKLMREKGVQGCGAPAILLKELARPVARKF